MPEILQGVRVVADPEALDTATWAGGSTPLRIAPDDVFVLGATTAAVADPHAIVEPETMYAGMWMDRDTVGRWVSANADWLLPTGDGFSQGMVAALPVKILTQGSRALVFVPTGFAHELDQRLGRSGPDRMPHP